MNILHMNYALEVARAGSINKAAESLLVAQPNVSRAIKELENDLGITIFVRSPKGMQLTLDGVEFIRYANKISSQIQQVETFYKQGREKKERFSLSAPKSNYIALAVAGMLATLPPDELVDVTYDETTAAQTIENVLHQDYQLGIIRYRSDRVPYYEVLLQEKGLEHEFVTDVYHGVVLRKQDPLAAKKELHLHDLGDMTEIVLGNPRMPSLPTNDARKELPLDDGLQQVVTFDRFTQMTLVSKLEGSFMWASPMEEGVLDSMGLVWKKCAEYLNPYRDELIYRKGYQLTEAERIFVRKLQQKDGQE